MKHPASCPSCPRSPVLAVVLLALTVCLGVRAQREGAAMEGCGEGKGVGDKWFDGCQWCVCTVQGPRCSSSACSSLVQQVPACHVPGQRWTDGCYRCRCRRQGITCHLDVTCRSLRHQPVPCLADERCVCGPDGVPSCTAEVIDRNAFVARRIQLGFPHVLQSRRGMQDSHRGHHSRHGGHRGHAAQGRAEDRLSSLPRAKRQLPARQDYFRRHHSRYSVEDARAGTQQGLPFSMISRQLRLGSADQPEQSLVSSDPSAQELLIMSDNLCLFGARWYGGSLRCFCDEDGAIACGNPVFVLAFFDDFRVEAAQCEEGHAWENGCSVCTCQMNGVIFCTHSQQCSKQHTLQGGGQGSDPSSRTDHYLEGIIDELSEESMDVPSTPGPHRNRGVTLPGGMCMPGSHWTEGCRHCRCTRHARQLCSPRHCGQDDVDTTLSSQEGDDQPWMPAATSNHAKAVPASLGLPFKRSRRPMLVAPKPPGGFQLPAYALGSIPPLRLGPCGRFGVGHKYWDECNLCLCTSRGPRCQGKLCH